MANDRLVGGAIFGGSIIGVIVYGLLVYWWPLIVLQISAFLAVLLLLGILAWIGYTMATTPPPEPITDIPDVSAGTKPEAPEKKPDSTTS
jgi:predicted DNA-binding transcriptional regulator